MGHGVEVISRMMHPEYWIERSDWHASHMSPGSNVTVVSIMQGLQGGKSILFYRTLVSPIHREDFVEAVTRIIGYHTKKDTHSWFSVFV